MEKILEMFLLFGYLLSLFGLSLAHKPRDKPNIVIMLADDLGYGDVGCFGNLTIPTPNIDKLAEQGVKLTHHLAAASVCTPSRAAFLTGRYPIRSGMVSNDIRVMLNVASSCGLPSNETTIAELAKSKDYKTALIGSWHLGLSRSYYGDNVYHPLNQGFDYFYGTILSNINDFGKVGEKGLFRVFTNVHINKYLSITMLICIFACGFLYVQGYLGKCSLLIVCMLIFVPPGSVFIVLNNMKIFNSILMRNFEIVEQPVIFEKLTERYVREGVDFLEQRKIDQSPFLLFMSWNRAALKTAKKFEGVSKHGRYGDTVIEMDWGIGEIMASLGRLGLAKNTLVYFSSDNGGRVKQTVKNGEMEGGFNGILKGGKGDGAGEGGIRVPGIVWYPEILANNSVISEPSMQTDMFTTFAKLMGAKLPEDRIIDGKDLMPLLVGKEVVSPQRFYFHYCGEKLHAVRYRHRSGSKVWKLVYEIPDKCNVICFCVGVKQDPPVLYEMTSDPSESRPINITSDSKYMEIVDRINKAVVQHQASIIHVETQFSILKHLWKPWLQPCCNFPYCSCQDPKYANTD